MRALIFLLALLISAPAFAGPGVRGVMRASRVGSDFTANSIKGITSISSAGTTDTGTGTGYLYAGTISTAAVCDSSGIYGSDVRLYVDGVQQDILSCSGDVGFGDTLSYVVTEGTHTVRIVGFSAGTATFSAGTFSLPVTP